MCNFYFPKFKLSCSSNPTELLMSDEHYRKQNFKIIFITGLDIYKFYIRYVDMTLTVFDYPKDKFIEYDSSDIWYLEKYYGLKYKKIKDPNLYFYNNTVYIGI